MQSHDLRREQLIQLRHRLRLTQLEVAKAIKVNRTSYCLWENGYDTFSDERLSAIEAYLGEKLSSLQGAHEHTATISQPRKET